MSFESFKDNNLTKYTFNKIYKKSKVVLETEKYLIHRRVKSNYSFADNYLEIKEIPQTEGELQYYIDACKEFFRDKGISFVHLALPEKKDISNKLQKFLKKKGYNQHEFILYLLDSKNCEIREETIYDISLLEKQDFQKYIDFNYKIDLEYTNKTFADENKNLAYEILRDDDVYQLVAKDKDNLIATVNVIVKSEYIEISNLYVEKEYRQKNIASSLLKFAIKKFKKKYVILIADFYDTPKYMYEKMGFKEVSSKKYFIKTVL
jgi:hypothetical protein